MSSSNVPAADMPSASVVVVPTRGGEVKTVPAFPFPVEDSQLVDVKTWGIGNQIPEPDLSLVDYKAISYDEAARRLDDLDKMHALGFIMQYEDTFYQHLDDRFEDIKTARYETTMKDFVKYQCRVCGQKMSSSATLKSHLGTGEVSEKPACKPLKGEPVYLRQPT